MRSEHPHLPRSARGRPVGAAVALPIFGLVDDHGRGGDLVADEEAFKLGEKHSEIVAAG
jgi:hypothetical protein